MQERTEGAHDGRARTESLTFDTGEAVPLTARRDGGARYSARSEIAGAPVAAARA